MWDQPPPPHMYQQQLIIHYHSLSLTNCFTTVPAFICFVGEEIFLPFLLRVFMLGASVLFSTVPVITRGAYLPAELYPPLDFQLVRNFVLQSSTSLLLF